MLNCLVKKRKLSFSLYSEEVGSLSDKEEEYIPYITPRNNLVRETRNELPSELSNFEIPSLSPLLRSDSKIMFGK